MKPSAFDFQPYTVNTPARLPPPNPCASIRSLGNVTRDRFRNTFALAHAGIQVEATFSSLKSS